MSKTTNEITDYTSPTSDLTTTIAATSHHHLETTNESPTEENTPLELFLQNWLGMEMRISSQDTPLFALCCMTYTTEYRRKIHSTPQTKTVSMDQVVDLAINKHY
jgi:hypothetical protein